MGKLERSEVLAIVVRDAYRTQGSVDKAIPNLVIQRAGVSTLEPDWTGEPELA